VSLPRFGAPQSIHRVCQVYLCHLHKTTRKFCVGPYSQGIAFGFRFDWLAYQARYARVGFSRRTMHASVDAPCHLSAKHGLLHTAGSGDGITPVPSPQNWT